MSLLLAVVTTTPQLAPVVIERGGPSLLTPIIGGVAGALVALLIRSADVRAEVSRTNLAVGERDLALADWLADREIRLREDSLALHLRGSQAHHRIDPDVRSTASVDAMQRHNNAAILAREMDEEIARLRTDALTDYRDQRREVRWEVDKITADEQWQHRLWRRLSRQPEPSLTTVEIAEPLLDGWRMASTYGGRSEPGDATRRTLADVMASQAEFGP